MFSYLPSDLCNMINNYLNYEDFIKLELYDLAKERLTKKYTEFRKLHPITVWEKAGGLMSLVAYGACDVYRNHFHINECANVEEFMFIHSSNIEFLKTITLTDYTRIKKFLRHNEYFFIANALQIDDVFDHGDCLFLYKSDLRRFIRDNKIESVKELLCNTQCFRQLTYEKILQMFLNCNDEIKVLVLSYYITNKR